MPDMMDSLTKLGIFADKMPNVTSAGNATSTLVDTLLATASSSSPLIHLLLFIYRLLGMHSPLDPSILLTLLGSLWGLQYVFSQLYMHVMSFVERHLMCSIAVSESDTIYFHLMEWLSKQPSLNNNRYLMAQTIWKSAWEEEDVDGDGETDLSWTDVGQGGKRYLNFSNQAARSVPRYVPAMGSTSFWHGRTRFRVYRRKESMISTNGWQAMKDKEELKISCYGRSIAPIKQLLAEAKLQYYHDTHQKTTIFRPRQKEQRRDYSMWQQVARRPVRPMSTVVLDSAEKHDVLADINEYLHPRTPRWYASRGIPLRRGYLFHGPPGTGKTSFSFALAGVFGIDIYVISLQDVSVTEEDLAALFTRLPRRCIVLLEDIDTAGLRRSEGGDGKKIEDKKGDAQEKEKRDEAEKVKTEEKDEAVKDKVETNRKKVDAEKEKADGEKKIETETNGEKVEEIGETLINNADEKKKKKKHKTKKKSKRIESDSDSDSSSDSSSDSDSDSSDLDRISRKRRKPKTKKAKKGRGRGSSKLLAPDSVSLSGLLNAIDGVASHEGRVLIMTTNKPEALDAALVRPGRVDMQVSFAHASSTQAGELFHRMYEAPWRQPQQILESETALLKTGLIQEPAKSTQEKQEDVVPISAEELKGLSEQFGEMIPAGVFSPAEIQGFLLKRKKSPRKAFADAQGWIEATIKSKEIKSKVLTVQ